VKDSQGFTLLEVLVSITLMAVLVVILSMALRSGINAYSRVRDYNNSFFPKAALQGLLFRQLEAVVAPGRGIISAYSLFKGEGDKLLFVTTYGPQGLGQGGLLKVVYWFDESDETLFYAQRIVVKKQEVRQELPDRFYDMSEKELKKKGWTVAALKGVKAFSLSYHYSLSEQEKDPEKWPEEFKNRHGEVPIEIGVSVTLKKESAGQKVSRDWVVVPVGIM